MGATAPDAARRMTANLKGKTSTVLWTAIFFQMGNEKRNLAEGVGGV